MPTKKIGLLISVVIGTFALALLMFMGNEESEPEKIRTVELPIGTQDSSNPGAADSDYRVTELRIAESDETDAKPTPWENTIEIDPGATYKNYVANAVDGDIESAFVLVSSMRQCRFIARSEDEIRQKYAEGGHDEELVEHQVRRLNNCKSLFDEVQDVDAEYNIWYQIVRESGHPLFQVKQRSLPYQKLKPLVVAALSEQYPESYLYADAFGAASRMYLEYPEHGIDENKFHAWQLMTCSAIIGCDHDQMLSELRAQLPKQQVDEIHSLEMTYAESVSSGDTSMFDH
ncbi:MAG: hypothetical protein OEU36_20155 [Gammaproteobacteria bacterium]|nr:hypothetical protein [Gammaproteobacteria bacterium]